MATAAALVAAPSAGAEPRFGAPFTVGQTKKPATYLTIVPAADGGAVVATGGHAVLNDDPRGHLLVSHLRADGRFGRLLEMRVRVQPCGLRTGDAVGPLVIAAGPRGRLLSCEVAHRIAFTRMKLTNDRREREKTIRISQQQQRDRREQ